MEAMYRKSQALGKVSPNGEGASPGGRGKMGFRTPPQPRVTLRVEGKPTQSLVDTGTQQVNAYVAKSKQGKRTRKPGKYGYKYLLVFVDTFSGWVEAFPTKQETATMVAKKILEEKFSEIRSAQGNWIGQWSCFCLLR